MIFPRPFKTLFLLPSERERVFRGLDILLHSLIALGNWKTVILKTEMETESRTEAGSGTGSWWELLYRHILKPLFFSLGCNTEENLAWHFLKFMCSLAVNLKWLSDWPKTSVFQTVTTQACFAVQFQRLPCPFKLSMWVSDSIKRYWTIDIIFLVYKGNGCSHPTPFFDCSFEWRCRWLSYTWGGCASSWPRHSLHKQAAGEFQLHEYQVNFATCQQRVSYVFWKVCCSKGLVTSKC